MTWTSFHRRGETLRAVEMAANERVDSILPTDIPGVREHFRDDLDLIAALMLRWHTRLSGNLERALADEPWDLEAAVVRAWADTALEMRGVRMIIDHYTHNPVDDEMGRALLKAELREWMRLATAAGLASDQSDAAAAVGHRVQDEARELLAKQLAERAAEKPNPTSEHASHVSLVERIKAVIAA